jgi:hypothetical protein
MGSAQCSTLDRVVEVDQQIMEMPNRMQQGSVIVRCEPNVIASFIPVESNRVSIVHNCSEGTNSVNFALRWIIRTIGQAAGVIKQICIASIHRLAGTRKNPQMRTFNAPASIDGGVLGCGRTCRILGCLCPRSAFRVISGPCYWCPPQRKLPDPAM